VNYLYTGLILFAIAMIVWYVRYPDDRRSLSLLGKIVGLMALAIVLWPISLVVVGYLEFSGYIKKHKFHTSRLEDLNDDLDLE